MGDGYYSTSVMICTDNFTKDEVIVLIDILEKKDRKSTRLNPVTRESRMPSSA